MIDINGFRSTVTDGLARPSLFEVFFPALPNVPGSVNVQDSVVKVAAASLPEMSTQSIDVYYQGRPIPVMGERIFRAWQVTVYNSEDFGLRDFFEGWNNRGNTLIGNQTELNNNIFASGGGYKVDGVIVRQFAKHKEKIRAVSFYGIYPEIVGPIQLSWAQGNQIETFDVQFRYDFWIPSTTSDEVQSSPGTYDVEGTSPGAGVGSAEVGLNQGAPGTSVNAVQVGGTT